LVAIKSIRGNEFLEKFKGPRFSPRAFKLIT
jgi:hypothetical protein